MSQKRTEMDRLQELVRLHRMGSACREVARLLAISPNTERQYREILAAEGLLDGIADGRRDDGGELFLPRWVRW